MTVTVKTGMPRLCPAPVLNALDRYPKLIHADRLRPRFVDAGGITEDPSPRLHLSVVNAPWV